MSYQVTLDNLKLDVLIPKDQAISVLEMDESGETALTKDSLKLALDEGEFAYVPLTEEGFHLTDKVITMHSSNHNWLGDLFRNLAVKFGGDYSALEVGEDGQTSAIKVVKGQEKKVKILVVEED